MQLRQRKLEGPFELIFEPVRDDRGVFLRHYDRKFFADNGLQTVWEQESVSFNSSKSTLRGLHFQMPPLVEAKIVRVTYGAIWDVFVDLRTDSATYGQWDALELSASISNGIYIPKGFAHGFCTLAENTIVEYKIDVAYRPDLAGGIRWNDPSLAVDWKVEDPIISDRDANLQFFADFNSPF